MHELIAEKLFVCGAEDAAFMELFRGEEAKDEEHERKMKKLENFTKNKVLIDETFIGAA
jgi:hypothetical protein